MLAHPDHADWRPDVWILNTILALWMSTSERESRSFGLLQRSSHNCVLEGNLEACQTLSRSEVLLKRPEGCKLEQF